MWIKTQAGVLVNTDTFSCMTYDSDANQTIGKNDHDYHDYAVLAEGNVIPQIITAIRRGDNYLGVN